MGEFAFKTSCSFASVSFYWDYILFASAP